ncbi:hypothetical protein L1987_64541 [Smallanthus sonchifolius]|uniref:Uncharacterized protein n=1 Tax=Smallanthus sonchifolius TaxID=185202 RepID=A0ACB9BRX2_9ASTR|nr:hypothetical protein L1987_64541 [Smallanthus sonchifolius]
MAAIQERSTTPGGARDGHGGFKFRCVLRGFARSRDNDFFDCNVNAHLRTTIFMSVQMQKPPPSCLHAGSVLLQAHVYQMSWELGILMELSMPWRL